jgi:hypothetical protein
MRKKLIEIKFCEVSEMLAVAFGIGVVVGIVGTIIFLIVGD